MKKFDRTSIILLSVMILLDVFVWKEIIFGLPSTQPKLYFVDVSQGDSELVILPGNIKILTDAGPDAKVVKSLERILPSSDRYIDIGIISHPQLDHFNGFNELLKRYKFGVFITNGRDDDPNVKEWPQFLENIKNAHIPLIVLGAGDSIKNNESRIDFLSPNANFVQSGELNDTGFVELINSPPLRALLTADTGWNIEDYLIKKFDIHADVLKVGHHGSKYSSGNAFLESVDPKVAVIEVGAKNHYGHPTKEVLSRLASSTFATVFRTDQNGTVEVVADGNQLKVFTEK